MTIRPEQIDLSNYLTSSEVSGLIPDTSTFATTTEVSTTSGILDTKINTLSGSITGYATSTELATTSGILNTYITDSSGILDSYISNSSGSLNTYITNSSGCLDTYVTNSSGILDAKINTLSGHLDNYSLTSSVATTSGILNTKIDTLSGYISDYASEITLDNLSGVVLSSVASGQSLVWDGNYWINSLVQSSGTGGATDHGALTGLSDDDHSDIYYNKQTIDNMSGALYSGYIAGDSASGGEIPVCLLYRGTPAQSVASQTETNVQWNAKTDISSGTFTHSTISEPEKITVVSSGTYLLTANIALSDLNAGSAIGVYVKKNNVKLLGEFSAKTSADVYGCFLSRTFKLAANDYIYVGVWTGDASNLKYDTCYLDIIKIGS
jgi:hypothetical protein